MKSFFYFLLGVSVTLNTTLAIDYIKKAHACSQAVKQLEKKVNSVYSIDKLEARVEALEKKDDGKNV